MVKKSAAAPTRLTCRFKHSFVTAARPESTVRCPVCKDTGINTAVWVPKAAPTWVGRNGQVQFRDVKLDPEIRVERLSYPCEIPGCESTLGMGFDHCHVHGWVRGILCGRCNQAMSVIDRRADVADLTPPGDIPWQHFADHWGKCLDCVATGPWTPGEPPAEKPHRGRRTSIYLSDELATAAKASGLTLGELVRRGLGTLATVPAAEGPATAVTRSITEAGLRDHAARDKLRAACPHPKARVLKGLCGACGTGGLS